MAAGDVVVTVVGNLTNDPELRFTPSGAAVASFTVASSSRVLDRTTNEWKDGETVFMRCSVWRQYAENVAESFQKGDRVVVVGRLDQSRWEDKETGKGRSKVGVVADEVAASVRWASVEITKTDRQQAPAQAPASSRGGGRDSGRDSGRGSARSSRGSGSRDSGYDPIEEPF